MSRVLSSHAALENELPRVLHRRSRLFGLWMLLLLCVVASPIYGQPNQQIPQMNSNALSMEEVRWCRHEVFRLAGEASEVRQSDYWEIHDYNLHVRRYRSLCLNRASAPNSNGLITKELTPVAKQGIRDAGVRRFAYGRINRNENRIYVTSTRHERVRI